MPRIAAVEHDLQPFSLEEPALPPPAGLSEEEQGYWRSIVSPGRFPPSAAPTLTELVRAMGRARRVGLELNELRQENLEHAKVRSLFAQLARQAREESKLIAALSTKLRMTGPNRHGRHVYDGERQRQPAGVPPWAQG
jgi:hypothetical protein